MSLKQSLTSNLPHARRKPERRYAGQSSEQRERERRKRLMETGLDLFTQLGYQNTTVEKICSQAKVTTRHFYQHFRNREALLEALLAQLREDVTSVVLSAMQQRGNPQERAMNTLRAFVDFYLGDPRRAQLGSVESVGINPRMEALRRKSIHQFAQFITIAANDLAAAGELPDRDYHLPSVALVGAVNELIVEWLTSDTGLNAQDISREVMLFFRALMAGAAQSSS